MEIGALQLVDIDEQMRTAYLDYAMSVIVSRALPDARDGLKPVHRRILFGMMGLGIHSNTPHKKSARIVGEVLGKYHPHGDMAVYDAMARMAQDFSMRYTLVDGQGNFGSVDGDAPAAMRYTEARLRALAEEMLLDIDKNTVDFVDNFDATLKEPTVLPSRVPNLLLNGSSGIAVGMATNIPPHNLRELSDALVYVIDHYEEIEEINVEDLMKKIPGPDFPTGGVIVGREGILQAYSTGRGKITLRGQAHIEEMKAGRFGITITEIPYQVNKSSLIERIADLVREGKIEAISDLRDESDRRGMSIVIELKKNCQPRQVLNQLYKYTALQSTFGIRLLALVKNEPRYLSLKRCLQIHIEHRQQVITRRSEFELEKARGRAHILEGLLIALDNLDEVIQTIRNSPDANKAKERLMKKFQLSELQSQAILDMQLRRLAALERKKIQDEFKQIKQRIAYLEDLLTHPKKILDVIKEDLIDLKEKFGDDRRTKINTDPVEELSEESLVHDEAVLISLTTRGYIKRTATSMFRTQNRGTRGVSGQTMRDEDEVKLMIPSRTLHTLLFFSNQGKVFSEKTYQIPDANRTDRGIPIVNILSLAPDEQITEVLSIKDFDAARFCTMVTAQGRIKRTALSEFASVRSSGLISISLDENDKLRWVRQTTGRNDLIIVSEQGKALRISENTVRVMGRQAAGVTAMNLDENDRITSMDVVEPNASLLVITEKGFGKRTSLEEYPVRGRATGGIATTDIKNLAKIGKVITARVVKDNEEITIISRGGIILKLRVSGIPVNGRATRGVKIMNLEEGDVVAMVARIGVEAMTTGENGKD